MKFNVSRRDFLNGIAIGTGAGLLAPSKLFALTDADDPTVYYPPTLTGIRGNHPGSFDVIHNLAWDGEKPAQYRKAHEHYDMVIVGAGVSGLAAARFYQKRAGKDAKILLLDNHDDFGGHAKRNEFHYNGRMLLGIGGSVNLDNPEAYSRISKGLLDDIGVDLERMRSNMIDTSLMGVATDLTLALPGPEGNIKVRADWFRAFLGIGDYESAVRALPYPEAELDKIIEFLSGDRDYLDDLSLSEKSDYINSVTYTKFLTERVGLSKETIPVFFSYAQIMAGPATSRMSVMDAILVGCPGLQGMGWLGDVAVKILDSLLDGSESLYFPDGNASIARLLVHKLIPGVAPDAHGFDDIAISRFDYSELDLDDHPVRLRLNSTVVAVEEMKDESVRVDYVRDGEAVSVTGDHCVLACYNAAIPFLCPQLPEPQKEALRYSVKVPLVVTNVLVSNGSAFAGLGVGQVAFPDDPYAVVVTAPATTTGGHRPPDGPEDPLVIFMIGAPKIDPVEGETSRDILRRARHNVYTTTFDTYEREVRQQLQGLLGEYGFNHEKDIKAITVNRWPHGYAYEYQSVDDPEWPEGRAPHEVGRAQFGRISIANSDSEGSAYLNKAIDAGWRAVAEQTQVVSSR